MHDLTALIARHGAVVLFGWCFLEAAGVPIPAALALLIGGAAAAQGWMPAGAGWAAAMGGLLLGDTLLFLLGRYTGWWLLGVLCRVTANPEACIYSSAHTFYRKGRVTLLLAKFVPGLAAMAAPLAGSMNMSLPQFLALDAAGAALYVSAYGLAGYLSADLISVVVGYFQAAGRVVETILVAALAGYVAWRLWLGWKSRELRSVPRVPPTAIPGGDDAVVFDVRSHGYYGSNVTRIKGARRLEPNRLMEAAGEMPSGKKLYFYCTCYNEATSVRVAHMLRQQGHETFVIQGGLRAWQKAGQPTELVPPEDIVQLPTFARRQKK